MGKEAKELRFKMFGGFSVLYGGKELKLDKSGTTKMMQLLAMLIYHREGIAREALLRNLYGDKELTDPNNNLRVTVFKLRKMLVRAGLPEGNYVLVQNNIYMWASDLPISCDVWEFRKCIADADTAQDTGDFQQELALRRKACALYTHEFLQVFSGEDWVVLEAIPLKQKYMDCLRRLCGLLEERKLYSEVVDLCSFAESIYPYDEWQLIRIDALMAMNQYDEALAVYQEYTERYFEELGLLPTEEMQSRYEKINNMMQRPCTTVDEIYSGLMEKQDSVGAAYVSYLNFIDRFRFLQRISERSGESNFLVVATILRKSGKPLDASGPNSKADEVVRSVLRDALRRTDTFTRYNSSQYLMLLVGIDLESVKIVTRRIDQKLLNLSGGMKLICRHRALPIRQPEFPRQELGWSFSENKTEVSGS